MSSSVGSGCRRKNISCYEGMTVKTFTLLSTKSKASLRQMQNKQLKRESVAVQHKKDYAGLESKKTLADIKVEAKRGYPPPGDTNTVSFILRLVLRYLSTQLDL